MKTTAHLLIAALFLSMTSSACITWFPDKVGNGVARLAVRNAGALTSLISVDEVCGFEEFKGPYELHPERRRWWLWNCYLAR